MNDLVGLPQELIEMLNRHLSAGTLGEYYVGLQLDALANGMVYGFNNAFLIPDTVGVTVGVAKSTSASGIATEEIYHILGEKGYLRARTLSAAASAVAADNGIQSSSTYDGVARGVYHFSMGDVDGAACSAFDQNDDLWLPINTAQNWNVSFGISGSANLDQLATIAFAEFGVTGATVSLDPAVAMAAARATFRIAAGNITCTNGTAVVNCGAVPSSKFILSLRYNAKTNLVHVFVNEKPYGHFSMGVVTAVQVAGRVCHLAAYAALADIPVKLDLDYVIASTPNFRANGG